MAERRPRGPCNFRQRDLDAALLSAKRAGFNRCRVILATGEVIVERAPDVPELPPQPAEVDEWAGEDEPF